ncbi:hypothetical protein Q5425_06115 [Amycolatopsis sp. A133]|uniref:hypothetical protein n=1 Tax=Amycolatopsis sp. A133 TaxID=3064472 RepID=UPI0027F97E1A|nr:hypothetical protein [Amycolatopsis sp. A133]MDQ7803296.1 hypothetical protein [Amycolatopsis sp. A133]
MSSGTVAVAPVGLPIVAAGAIVVAGALAVTAGAVLLARAVNSAAESGVRALGESGARLEAEIAAIEAAEAAGQWRRRAMADVVAVNARLRLVRERAKKAGVALPVPRPLTLSAEVSAARAVQWVSETEYEIARLHKELDAAAPPLRVTITAKTSRASGDISAELDRLRRVATERHTKRPAAVAAASITEVIGLLDPDATTQERDEMLAEAAAIVGRTEQSVYLSSLRSKIVATLNPRIERRRLAATWVSALEDGPLAEVVAGIDPPAPLRRTAAALREVVTGAHDLTPELRSEGVRLMAWAGGVADRAFMRDLVRKCLTEAGQEVLETFEGDGFTGLRFARPEWGDEHSTVVRVRDGNIIEHHLEAAHAPTSDNKKLIGEERCAAANAGIQAVAEAAAAAGVRVQLTESAPQVSGHEAPAAEYGTDTPIHRYRDGR